MPESDWTQFIPDLIAGLVLLIVGGVVAYCKSGRFKKWLKRLLDTTIRALKWLTTKWHFILLHSLVIGGAIVLRIYADWRILVFAFVCYVVGLLSWRLSIGRSTSSGRSKQVESEAQYIPIPLMPGIVNSHLKNRYIAPPSGDVFLGKAQFRLEPDALIFDTNEGLHYYLPHDDGSKEVDLQLREPQNQVKSVDFLINSSNSKDLYVHQSIGEIKLVFRDAPPIVVELVLGENIREWCLGNPGDFVREASSSMLTMDAWTGLAKNGVHAVIDCLQIPVYECMRNCFLDKIVLVHKPLQRPTDTMGVHFSIFAVSLEIAQGM